MPTTTDLFAHSKNRDGNRQTLQEHLANVASLAEVFAADFGGQGDARLAGLLHDIGKVGDWQERLLELEAGKHPAFDKVRHDHKMASAAYAYQQGLTDVAQVIAGHHGGMMNFADLVTDLKSGKWDANIANATTKLDRHLKGISGTNTGSDFYRRGCK